MKIEFVDTHTPAVKAQPMYSPNSTWHVTSRHVTSRHAIYLMHFYSGKVVTCCVELVWKHGATRKLRGFVLLFSFVPPGSHPQEPIIRQFSTCVHTIFLTWRRLCACLVRARSNARSIRASAALTPLRHCKQTTPDFSVMYKSTRLRISSNKSMSIGKWLNHIAL